MCRLARLLVAVAAVLTLTAACGDGDVAVEKPPRAVTTVTLARTAPELAIRRTGAVEPFRQEDVAFEVGGRVQEIRGVGDRVQVAVELLNGKTVRTGDVIARLDPTRYELALAGLLAKREAAAADLRAKQIEVDRGGAADLAAAEANLTAAKQQEQAAVQGVEAAEAQERLSRQTYDSEIQLLESGATSQFNVDQARAALDSATAAVRQARATLDAAAGIVGSYEAAIERTRATVEQRTAQVAAAQAQLGELEQSLARARRDVEDCTLRAPFDGRVTAVHVAEGAVVAAGTPVATITLLDPVLVSVALGAAENRLIRMGSQALVTAPDAEPDDPPLYGGVYEQGDVADAATRTFLIRVIVRNSEFSDRSDASTERPRTLGLRDLAIVEARRGSDGERRLFVPMKAFTGGPEQAVLRLVGISAGTRRSWKARYALPTERVPVRAGDGFFASGPWDYRELVESGALQVRDVVILNPAPEDERGAMIAPYIWALRPGDLVPVVFPVGSDEEGFWVPLQCVLVLDGESFVFVERDGVARRLAVETAEPAFPAERIRIDSPELSEGDRIVLSGLHYLADGERVKAVAEETP